MGKPTGPTNPILLQLIRELKEAGRKNNILLWRRIADELEKPTRLRREVNLAKIEQVANDNDIILVPGKVLGVGEITKKVKIAAWQFSTSAKQKVKSPLTIQQVLKENPTGKGVRIIG